MTSFQIPDLPPIPEGDKELQDLMFWMRDTAEIINQIVNELDANHRGLSGLFASGAHTGTVGSGTNITSVSMLPGFYIRQNQFVLVAGAFSLQPTNNTTSTQALMTLPIASTFVSNRDLAGVCNTAGIAGASGVIVANVATGEARFSLISEHTDEQNYSYVYMYEVL